VFCLHPNIEKLLRTIGLNHKNKQFEDFYQELEPHNRVIFNILQSSGGSNSIAAQNAFF
jgi:hypothetical protein